MILGIYDVEPTLKHSDDKTDRNRLKKTRLKHQQHPNITGKMA
jgi:hypothetical protein